MRRDIDLAYGVETLRQVLRRGGAGFQRRGDAGGLCFQAGYLLFRSIEFRQGRTEVYADFRRGQALRLRLEAVELGLCGLQLRDGVGRIDLRLAEVYAALNRFRRLGETLNLGLDVLQTLNRRADVYRQLS